MANNEYVNRVDYGDDTLIDISDTTAEAGDVLQGETFYLRNGAPATGTLGDATTSTHGLMSAADKTKLDNLQDYNSATTIIDTASYAIRQAGGGNTIGTLANDTIVGSSVFWYQNLEPISASNMTCNTDVCTGEIADGGYRITVTVDSDEAYIEQDSSNLINNLYADNLYYISFQIRTSVPTKSMQIYHGNHLFKTITNNTGYGIRTYHFLMHYNYNYQNAPLRFYFDKDPNRNFTIGDKFTLRNLTAVNITTALNSRPIANYIYSLEQATSGAGVELVHNLFPIFSYEKHTSTTNYYQAINAQIAAHKTIGFNVFNVATGKGRVLEGQDYQITGPYTSLIVAGITTTPRPDGTFTPKNTGDVIVTGGGPNTCIHLVKDGSRNGEFEPYYEELQAFPDITLRGIPKLDSNNNIYFDGDEYRSDGIVIRKYGEVSINDLTWEKYGEDENPVFRAELANMKVGTTNIMMPSNVWPCASAEDELWTTKDKAIYKNSDGKVYIRIPHRQDGDTVETFVGGWGASTIVYELETPIVEFTSKYSSLRKVDPWGTEEFITRNNTYVHLPIGHKTQYLSSNLSNLISNTLLSNLLTNEMGVATASTPGSKGLVPAPGAGDQNKFLSGDGTWKAGGLPMVILGYGKSTWDDFINAYNNNVIVYCRASSSTDPSSGNQLRMAFMAYVNKEIDPTEVEFQYYRSVSSHTSSQYCDQVFVYKLNKTSGWSVITRYAGLKEIKAGTGISVNYNSNNATITNVIPAAPTTDGTYTLQITVSNGTPTYSWI